MVDFAGHARPRVWPRSVSFLSVPGNSRSAASPCAHGQPHCIRHGPRATDILRKPSRLANARVSQVFWPIFAPSNVLIFITSAAAVFALLLRSKLAAWLAAIGGCALIIGSFTPVSYWLTLPLENRFPHWRAGFQAGLTASKRLDPLVVFLGASYFSSASRDIALTQDNPSDIAGLRVGGSLAISPSTSVTTGFNVAYLTNPHFSDFVVPNSDRVLSTVDVGFSTIVWNRTLLNVTAQFGVTGHVPDFRVITSLPIRF